MKGLAYVPQDGVFPFLGLDTFTPSTQLDGRYSPGLENVELQKGIVGKRRGYLKLGDTLEDSLGGAQADPVIGVHEFETLSGTKILLAFTTKRQYKWDGTDWDNITYASGGSDVLWTGTEDDWLDVATVSGLDSTGTYKKWVVISNGKDTPRYWDGSLGTFLRFHTDTVANGGALLLYPSFVTYRAMAQFYNHVVIANVQATATQRNLVAWSDTGDLVDFTGTGSGSALLPDSKGQILRLLPLGDRLVIYSENSISFITYVAGDLIYSFENVLNETRLVSARSIVDLGPYHLFLTEENVMAFDGSKFPRPIGDRIFRQYREELYVPARKKAFAFHDAARQHVYFSVPTKSNKSVFYRLEYDLSDMSRSAWTRLNYTDRPVSMGTYSRNATLFWNSASLAGLAWNEVTMTWKQGTIREAFPIRVFGGTSGEVFIDDEIATRDDTVAIDAWWDSKDFAVPQSFRSVVGRWLEIELDLKGYEADIYTSTDEGETYVFQTKLELESNWRKYTVPVDLMSKHLRVRVRNACINSRFLLRWLRVRVREGGPS